MPRPARTEVVQGERRRRRDSTLDRMHGRKLGLPAQFRDDPNYVYVWANDDNSRIYDLTVEDDYDAVTISNAETSEEEKVRRPVGTKESGEPMYAYLLRKPKELADEDLAAREQGIQDREKGMLRSAKTDPQDNRPDDVSYVVPGNTLKRGAYAP